MKRALEVLLGFWSASLRAAPFIFLMCRRVHGRASDVYLHLFTCCVPVGDNAASPRLEFPLTPQSTGDTLPSSASVGDRMSVVCSFPSGQGNRIKKKCTSVLIAIDSVQIIGSARTRVCAADICNPIFFVVSASLHMNRGNR